MNSISKIALNNTVYDIEDKEARGDLVNIASTIPVISTNTSLEEELEKPYYAWTHNSSGITYYAWGSSEGYENRRLFTLTETPQVGDDVYVFNYNANRTEYNISSSEATETLISSSAGETGKVTISNGSLYYQASLISNMEFPRNKLYDINPSITYYTETATPTISSKLFTMPSSNTFVESTTSEIKSVSSGSISIKEDKDYYAWTYNGTTYYTMSENPSVGDTLYVKEDGEFVEYSGLKITAVSSNSITLDQNEVNVYIYLDDNNNNQYDVTLKVNGSYLYNGQVNSHTNTLLSSCNGNDVVKELYVGWYQMNSPAFNKSSKLYISNDNINWDGPYSINGEIGGSFGDLNVIGEEVAYVPELHSYTITSTTYFKLTNN